MNDYERCKRNHPSSWDRERRTIEEMEQRWGESAPEPDYAEVRRKRGGRRKPRYKGVYWLR